MPVIQLMFLGKFDVISESFDLVQQITPGQCGYLEQFIKQPVDDNGQQDDKYHTVRGKPGQFISHKDFGTDEWNGKQGDKNRGENVYNTLAYCTPRIEDLFQQGNDAKCPKGQPDHQK